MNNNEKATNWNFALATHWRSRLLANKNSIDSFQSYFARWYLCFLFFRRHFFHYLGLTNIPFKDRIKAIDDRAEFLSIIITNYKTDWTKENSLDYVTTTLQGDALHLLKQLERSEEGKHKKLLC